MSEDCPTPELHVDQLYGERFRYWSWADPYIDGKSARAKYRQSRCPGCKFYKIWTLKKSPTRKATA